MPPSAVVIQFVSRSFFVRKNIDESVVIRSGISTCSYKDELWHVNFIIFTVFQ